MLKEIRETNDNLLLLTRVRPPTRSNDGLISESLSLWLTSLKVGAKSFPWALSIKRENVQGTDLASIFGDVGQSEKLSEIKPPLAQVVFQNSKYNHYNFQPSFMKLVSEFLPVLAEFVKSLWELILERIGYTHNSYLK